jgi:gliding motility-associated-like protein
LKKWVLILLIIFAFASQIFATHNRAGEITYRQISELTYEITLVTYTYTPSAANETRDYLPMSWGDNTNELIPRISEVYLPDQYTQNIYKATHTYPGPGIYFIVMEDPNRNEGVDNIPGSVNVVFSIATTLKIDAAVGFNSTPVLLNPPLDKAIVGQTFIHNPAAFDAEGDSLSYELTICRQENGMPIPDYTFPPASDDFYVNALTGDLVWDAPMQVGVYNVAMLIEEWRNGIKIGQIIRDMQIEVEYGNDIKPDIADLADLCVEAGANVNFSVSASDVDGDYLILEAAGGPFQLDPEAYLENINSTQGSIQGDFSWETNCSHVRYAPYQVVFKVTEQYNDPALVDFETVNISVVSPAPENLQASPTFNSIELSWLPCLCSQAIGYELYRKESPSNWTPDMCETGVPDGIGFEKIAHLEGYNNCSFTDNNNGLGLSQGFEYCYRVVAIFDDGAESYASDEVCTELELGYPLITKVSVDTTDETTGKIQLEWAKYIDFDTIALPGPYVYLIYRSNDLIGANLVLIDSTLSINDTSYLDENLNTVDDIYSYSVELYNKAAENRILIGEPQLASSPYLELAAGDNHVVLNLKRNTPWVNDTMFVYRMNPNSSSFDSIGFSLNSNYTDEGLINDLTYCYYVKTQGHYPPEEYSQRLINLSQINCAKPTDTIPPCSPTTNVNSVCDQFYNEIKWQIPDTCKEDVMYYNIYYSSTLDGDMDLIYVSTQNTDSLYLHYPQLSIAGCYTVTAVDSFANESSLIKKVCVDNCTYYELPNVFTPNGDSKNDYVVPSPYKYIDKVDMKIYNRWGVLVFETKDPDINWDGRYMKNGKMVVPGVYYYSCDVYERRLTGVEIRNLTGFIQVFDPKEQMKAE